MTERPIISQHHKLLDAAEAIRLDPDKVEAAFIARQLVQATLPHKNPGVVPLWSRTNGNLTLAIQSGMNIKTRSKFTQALTACDILLRETAIHLLKT